jgi:hypothetical protein
MWEKHGFHEELWTERGELEIEAEPHWMEEGKESDVRTACETHTDFVYLGIEHVGMWKRLPIEKRKRLSLSSLESI